MDLWTKGIRKNDPRIFRLFWENVVTCPRWWLSKKKQLSDEKNLGCLGCKGDYTTQNMGILISQYKDPYKPTSIMESRRGFFRSSIGGLKNTPAAQVLPLGTSFLAVEYAVTSTIQQTSKYICNIHIYTPESPRLNFAHW